MHPYILLSNRMPFSKASTLALVKCVARKILWQHRACYMSRGVDDICLGSHERDDRCLLPHLTFWAGPPEKITQNAGFTYPLPSGYRNWFSHTTCSTNLWPPVSGRFLTLLMWLHFTHSINIKDNPISKIHLQEWLNLQHSKASFPDHQGRAVQNHRPDFSAMT